jgi:DNA mismatch endonuclease (patch repair protein)
VTILAPRADWWRIKLNRDVERDTEKRAALQAHGWTVPPIWECETKRMDDLMPRLTAFLDD